MLCAVCNKESKNRRVCPYCYTPYPTEPVTGAGRRAGGRPGQQAGRRWLPAQSPVVRYSVAGIVLVLFFWWATREAPQFETEVVPPQVIATERQRDAARAVITQTRERAVVEIQQDEVFVSYPAAAFPVREAGQLALAQQFTNADEIVEGRKRRLYFYNPQGKLFAQADGVRGVVLVR